MKNNREIPLQSQERDPSFLRGTLIPWIICLLAALFYFYDFFLRVTPSVMIHPLMDQFNVGAPTIGFISAFYYYAYTPLQIPSGVIMDRYNPRWVLTLSALLCTVGAFVFATFLSLPAAFFGRILMGVGSAFGFIGALKLAALWLPKKHFALFAGIATALGTIGAVVADILLSRVVVVLGWRKAVYLTVYVSIGLTVLLFLLIRDKPSWVVQVPRSYFSWKHTWGRVLELLKNWRFWMAGFVGCFLFLPISVFASLWGVNFMIQAYHLPPAEGATAVALLFIGSALGFPFAGWFSDRIQNRRVPLFIGISSTFVLTLILIYVPGLPLSVALSLLFLIGFCVGPQALIFAIAREISPPRSTGISTAATNFIVTIGAAIFQPLIGYLLVLYWPGTQTLPGTPFYTVQNYQFALFVLPALLFIAFLMMFAVPKTACQKLYDQRHLTD